MRDVIRSTTRKWVEFAGCLFGFPGIRTSRKVNTREDKGLGGSGFNSLVLLLFIRLHHPSVRAHPVSLQFSYLLILNVLFFWPFDSVLSFDPIIRFHFRNGAFKFDFDDHLSRGDVAV